MTETVAITALHPVFLTGLAALPLGFLLDCLMGDPPHLPHVVMGMGKLISYGETLLRRLFPRTPAGEFSGGLLLALFLPSFSFFAAWAVLTLCALVHPLLRLLAESLFCWQCLALRSLGGAAREVYAPLTRKNLPGARAAVGRIVGRDTGALDRAGVIRAAVETVAENLNDGVVAPMFFLALGGAPLGLAYKAVNTMDSMLGYRNERYEYFGKAPARLDDAANFLPARISGLLLVLSAFLLRLDGKKAWRILLRDRHCHKSPNAGQTEAACAGALGLRLGGDSFYFGNLVHKPTLGDDDRPPEPEDIPRAVRLLELSAVLFLILCMAWKGVFLWL